MTQEEKQLLLKDLCERLKYGVKVLVQSHKGTFLGTLVTVTTKLSNILGEAWIEEKDEALWCDYSLFKPYLRPMSSMTKEELHIIESNRAQLKDGIWLYECVDEITTLLNSHHLDFRGLIPMGLALEAPKDMYKNK